MCGLNMLEDDYITIYKKRYEELLKKEQILNELKDFEWDAGTVVPKCLISFLADEDKL